MEDRPAARSSLHFHLILLTLLFFFSRVSSRFLFLHDAAFIIVRRKGDRHWRACLPAYGQVVSAMPAALAHVPRRRIIRTKWCGNPGPPPVLLLDWRMRPAHAARRFSNTTSARKRAIQTPLLHRLLRRYCKLGSPSQSCRKEHLSCTATSYETAAFKRY
ncbi:uncharacterized protein BDZ99DRAFT_104906 [Mytilinidion resinicola]|uniref:Secreted protein n=1 Tax=Mytilinidion resinicola TaxID=574789 RepID=A0A6A6Y9B5_9PEZI|nr:uncharacterized protein BDZ99DRAFT_104906 [Mytilinidion resinicola]KAF2805411.1 hypothetical protein BDZ99DRAFT_104906 [Mytilinidion resinicola]